MFAHFSSTVPGRDFPYYTQYVLSEDEAWQAIVRSMIQKYLPVETYRIDTERAEDSKIVRSSEDLKKWLKEYLSDMTSNCKRNACDTF